MADWIFFFFKSFYIYFATFIIKPGFLQIHVIRLGSLCSLKTEFTDCQNFPLKTNERHNVHCFGSR